NAE
ncbi:hypothetical protein D046_8465B, partial [Vibrio parahaemolyticus V-223/04]